MTDQLLIRCSSLGLLMTTPRSIDPALMTPELERIKGLKKRTDEEKALLEDALNRTLSETAKSHVRSLAAQAIYGVEFEISSKAIEKGLALEGAAIELVNRVRGLSLVKNTERRTDGYLTGEADCFDRQAREGHDTKVAWSIGTFPIVLADCADDDYLWQMRGYMKLWDAERWHVQYALLDTPEELIGYEPQAMHFVSHIPEHLRLTTWTVERDRSVEPLIELKVKLARAYMEQVIAEFDRSHPESGVLPATEPAPWEPPAAPVPAPAAKQPAAKPAPAVFELPDF